MLGSRPYGTFLPKFARNCSPAFWWLAEREETHSVVSLTFYLPSRFHLNPRPTCRSDVLSAPSLDPPHSSELLVACCLCGPLALPETSVSCLCLMSILKGPWLTPFTRGYGRCVCPSHHSACFYSDIRGVSEDHCPLCSLHRHECAWHIEPFPDHGQGVFHFLELGICPANIS